jgi:hypothetical protein
MALIDNKKNVFTTIGSYVSFMERTASQIDETTNRYPSINNKNDVVPFLLDVLKTVVGTDALKQLTGELLTTFIATAETQIKTVLKKQLTQFNAGDGLPSYFQSGGTGISIPVKDIDVYGKFAQTVVPDAKAQIDSLLFDTSMPNFDEAMKNAIANDGTVTPFGSALIMKYNSNTDKITFWENPALGSTIGTFVTTFINDMVIINKKEFLTNVLNAFYGSITAKQGKSVQQVYNELQVAKQIEQLFNGDDSFETTADEYDELQQQAQALVDGIVYYDLGCGLMEAEFPLTGMTALIAKISGSTDSFVTANAIESSLDQSTANNPETTAENKQTIRDSFFQRIIKMIQQMLAQITSTSPQIRAIQAIVSAFENNGITKIGNPVNDLKHFKILIKCLIKEIMKMINEYIFKLVVSFLVGILVPVIQKIIQEKINQYVGIVKSLIT